MSLQRQKIVVAMSGGVDSSVAAGLLVEQGHEVEGVSLRMWDGERGPRVCSDHRGAEEIAAQLGIRHTLLDLRAEFTDVVVRPFARDYLRGRTPNPCVACNRDFKLGRLLAWAKQRGADYVATGHYARIIRGHSPAHISLLRGADRAKDQSYFLFSLSRDQLAQALFPLGAMRKDEVRQRARTYGLSVADRPESQDICFGDYRKLVANYAAPGQRGGGEVVERSGKVLGRHGGIHGVTIGQRRGLGIAAAQPLYVVDIEAGSRRVIVGTKDQLGCVGLNAVGVSWIEPPREEECEAEVQLRYRSRAIPCMVRLNGEGSCEARFVEVVPAVTPGQAAVFYRGDRVLGGGWIERAIK